jgi:hypothetical protein
VPNATSTSTLLPSSGMTAVGAELQAAMLAGGGAAQRPLSHRRLLAHSSSVVQLVPAAFPVQGTDVETEVSHVCPAGHSLRNKDVEPSSPRVQLVQVVALSQTRVRSGAQS